MVAVPANEHGGLAARKLWVNHARATNRIEGLNEVCVTELTLQALHGRFRDTSMCEIPGSGLSRGSPIANKERERHARRKGERGLIYTSTTLTLLRHEERERHDGKRKTHPRRKRPPSLRVGPTA
jgi:hypothetical protein